MKLFPPWSCPGIKCSSYLLAILSDGKAGHSKVVVLLNRDDLVVAVLAGAVDDEENQHALAKTPLYTKLEALSCWNWILLWAILRVESTSHSNVLTACSLQKKYKGKTRF